MAAEQHGRGGRVGSRVISAAGAVVIAAAAVAGCGSSDGASSLPTRVPATPVAGPSDPRPPAGEPVEVSAARPDAPAGPVSAISAVSDGEGGSALITVQTTEPPVLHVLRGDGTEGPREIALPDEAGRAAVVATGDGPVALVPAAGKVVRVDLATGKSEAAEVDGRAVSAAALEDGRYAVGTAGGSVIVLGPDLSVQHTVTGFVSADSIAVTDGLLAVLDAHQTSITIVDPDDGSKAGALRVGKGATRIIADGPGRIVAIDTDGGQMLVFGVDPLLNRQLAPIGASPSALAADPARGLVWVTFTGSDEVAAFDLSSGEPEEVYRFPTVPYPTSVAVGADGAVYTGSGTGGGVVRIAPEEIR